MKHTKKHKILTSLLACPQKDIVIVHVLYICVHPGCNYKKCINESAE